MFIKLACVLWLAFLIVVGTIYFLVSRKSLSNIMSLLFITVCSGLILIISGFQFLGLAQIFIYTGSISIMMLFALMLIGFIPKKQSLLSRKRNFLLLPILFGFATSIGFYGFYEKYIVADYGVENIKFYRDSIKELGTTIYKDFAAPFDLAILLLLPVLISITLLHRNLLYGNTKIKRSADSSNKIPAAPAVYARNNSVDNLPLIIISKDEKERKEHGGKDHVKD